MSDLIDRQAAIDALREVYEYEYPTASGGFDEYATKLVPNTLKNLPSAQPEIKCIAKIMLTEEQVQEAFEKAKKEILAAQPERKKGNWIIKENPGTEWYRVTCSECGEDVTSVIPLIGFFPNVKPLWDFCPNCGAKMEVEK